MLLGHISNLLSSFMYIFSIWIFASSGFHSIEGTKDAHFLVMPNDKIVKTGATVTFEWIYEDTTLFIEKGEIYSHIGSNNTLLFRVDPQANMTAVFATDDYLKRVNIGLVFPIKLSNISARMVLSKVTTADTGYYSFRVRRFGPVIETSNVSLYVTERPHSLHINYTKPTPEINNVVYVIKKVGESLFLRCKVSGAPTPTVTWFNERLKRQAAAGSGVAVLSLNKITKLHAGNYTCHGNNSEGEVQNSITVRVTETLNRSTTPTGSSGAGQTSTSDTAQTDSSGTVQTTSSDTRSGSIHMSCSALPLLTTLVLTASILW